MRALATTLVWIGLAACAARPPGPVPSPEQTGLALAVETDPGQVRRKRRERRALKRNRRLVLAFKAVSIAAQADERGVKVTISDLLFEFGRHGLRPSAKDKLGRVAVVLMGAGRGRRIAVEGHSDAIGAELFNLNLSQRRAAAVARELERGGVAPALLSVVGYGSKYPVAADEATDGRDSPEGRARNRRVEIVVLD